MCAREVSRACHVAHLARVVRVRPTLSCETGNGVRFCRFSVCYRFRPTSELKTLGDDYCSKHALVQASKRTSAVVATLRRASVRDRAIVGVVYDFMQFSLLVATNAWWTFPSGIVRRPSG